MEDRQIYAGAPSAEGTAGLIRFPRRRIFIKLGLLFVSLILAVGASELILRALAPSGDSYYVWQPNLRSVFKPVPETMPGIEGESRFTINSFGIRGDPFSSDQEYYILAVGGSTTECLYLDDAEAWPYLVQKEMNAKLRNGNVCVGNVGLSAANTKHHRLQVEKLLEQYPQIDAVLLLIGINDLIGPLARNGKPAPFTSQPPEYDKILNKAFHAFPDKEYEHVFYKRLEIWRRFAKLKYRLIKPLLNGAIIQDEAGQDYVGPRERRQKATALREELPDLSKALECYSDNVNAIIDCVRRHKRRVIFVTQPVLYKAGLSKELSNLLWVGHICDEKGRVTTEYYSAEALATAMDIYNKKLLEICRLRGVECIDLAPLLPKDTSVFYDDCHFNESGSEKVARAIAQYLLDSK